MCVTSSRESERFLASRFDFGLPAPKDISFRLRLVPNVNDYLQPRINILILTEQSFATRLAIMIDFLRGAIRARPRAHDTRFKYLRRAIISDREEKFASCLSVFNYPAIGLLPSPPPPPPARARSSPRRGAVFHDSAIPLYRPVKPCRTVSSLRGTRKPFPL